MTAVRCCCESWGVEDDKLELEDDELELRLGLVGGRGAPVNTDIVKKEKKEERDIFFNHRFCPKI